jgi:hypothetical protein
MQGEARTESCPIVRGSGFHLAVDLGDVAKSHVSLPYTHANRRG